ncbi:MAG: hemerythrin family protein [Phaeospirillum sp.]|nr:hemerythrin family protein [Phaeospirillum sp.]
MPKLQNLMALRIGHPEIDQDHANLARIIDAIADSLDEDGGTDACKRLLASFIEAATLHFSREEHILGEIGFPGLDRHRLYHEELLEQAVRVKQNCDAMVERHHLRGCFEEMARFLIDDVIRGDMEFVSFLQERGIVSPALRI